MDLKQLRSFVAVAQSGSFSRSAEELYLSQPSISTHIRNLEEELGTTLLNRNAKNVELTENGKRVYEYACSILELQKRMLEEERREIRLAASTVPSAYLLPRMIADFSASHPSCSFSLTQSDSAGVAKGLLEHRYDLGFTGAELGERELSFTPICRDRMVLIAPSEERYRRLLGREDAVEELLSAPLILREEGSGSGGHLELLLNKLGIPKDHAYVAARVNDHEAIRNLVRCGMGVACISERALEQAGKELLVFQLPEELACRSLYLCRRRNSVASPQTEEFADYVLSSIRKSDGRP